MKTFDYSVVVPVYNSESSLKPLFDRTEALFKKLGKSFQVIFVDDGSKDASWYRVLEFKGNSTIIKAIRLAHNCGQQKATLCGIKHSDGNYIITIDDDLQIPPEEIEKLVKAYEETGADLIYGLFTDKHHSAVRNASSKFFNAFFAKFASTSGKGTSFRHISSDLASRISGINQKYLLLDEVLQWFTSNVAYCNVEHHRRAEGKSGYTFLKLVKIALGYLIYYTVFPLRLMTYVGFFSSLISFIVGMVYIYNRIGKEEEVVLGFTTTIVAIFFSTSVILFSLGIIGEYISRIYVQEISKPPYVIKEIQ